MANVVAEVKDVQEMLARLQFQVCQGHLIGGWRLLVAAERPRDLGQAIPGLAAEEKGIQMIVIPLEGALNGIVKIVQRLVIEHLDNPPHASPALQGNLDAKAARGFGKRRRQIVGRLWSD